MPTNLLLAAVAAIILGIYSFTLPKCPPQKSISKDASLIEQLGLNAFKLFAKYKMALFFIFSMFFGAALQLTNMYGDTFLMILKKYLNIRFICSKIFYYYHIYFPDI